MIKHVVYKYSFRFFESTAAFRMPAGSKVRHVGVDGQGLLCVWIEHPVPNEVNVTDERVFQFIGTGYQFMPSFDGKRLEFVGTAITAEGFVWHVYESVNL